MRIKLLLSMIMVVGALAISAGAAYADILIAFPPNPVAPPPTETTYLVQQTAPVNVSVLFMPNPGPPSVSLPNPGPPSNR